MIPTIGLLLSFVTYSPANEYFQGVQLNVGANYQQHKMALTGYGLGSKKVGLAHAKVAVNEFFSERPELFKRTSEGSLASLNDVGMMDMHLTFLRALDSGQVQFIISQYLQNSLSTEEKVTFKDDVDRVMSAIGGEDVIYAGKSISIIGDVASNSVSYINSLGASTVIHSQNTGFVLKVFSLWFGEPIDNDAWNLRQGLFRVPAVTGVTQ